MAFIGTLLQEDHLDFCQMTLLYRTRHGMWALLILTLGSLGLWMAGVAIQVEVMQTCFSRRQKSFTIVQIIFKGNAINGVRIDRVLTSNGV